MREIKFRGKRIDNGEWVYGNLITNINHKTFIALNDSVYSINGRSDVVNSHVHEVDPNTVGQYTGLKDKNGVEIYEGDKVVIEGQYPFFDEENEAYIGTVEWVFSQWQIILRCVDVNRRGVSEGVNEGMNDAGYEDGERTYWKVIGNIHEEVTNE